MRLYKRGSTKVDRFWNLGHERKIKAMIGQSKELLPRLLIACLVVWFELFSTLEGTHFKSKKEDFK